MQVWNQTHEVQKVELTLVVIPVISPCSIPQNFQCVITADSSNVWSPNVISNKPHSSSLSSSLNVDLPEAEFTSSSILHGLGSKLS